MWGHGLGTESWGRPERGSPSRPLTRAATLSPVCSRCCWALGPRPPLLGQCPAKPDQRVCGAWQLGWVHCAGSRAGARVRGSEAGRPGDEGAGGAKVTLGLKASQAGVGGQRCLGATGLFPVGAPVGDTGWVVASWAEWSGSPGTGGERDPAVIKADQSDHRHMAFLCPLFANSDFLGE